VTSPDDPDPAAEAAEAAITIPDFDAFTAVDDAARRAQAVAAEAEVERFGPTSEDAHPTVLHEALDRLRSFCLLLPETTEVTPFGHPTFRVAAKAYATFELVEDRASILFKATPESQAVLITREDFEPDAIAGHHGWTLVWLEGDIDWDEVDELIIASYRLVAPPEHVAQLDALLG
jgi:predicted DNA-binding protein (MmcQ/YjbR family)